MESARKIGIVFFISLFLFLILFFRSSASYAQTTQPDELTGEHIQNFSQNTSINKDGTIDVVETIMYNFGDLDRHGIYRDIPYVKTNAQGKKFAMGIDVSSVKDENGASYQYSQSDDGSTLHLKIGDPDSTITGVHTYVIMYHVAGALTYFSDHDELYWNVTGNSWTVPIAHAVNIITLPESIPAGELKGVCYTGYSGSTASDCKITVDDKTVMAESNNYFPEGSGLTVVVSFPKNIVAVLEPKPVINFSDTWYGKIIITLISVGIFLLTLFWYFIYPIRIGWNWFTKGRDPKTVKPLSAWYDPPKAGNRFLTAAETGTLIDERADFSDISAMVVQLAQRGYFKIVEKTKNNFSLVSTKDFESDESLLAFEKKFLDAAFEDSDNLVLKQAALYEELQTVTSMIYDQTVTDGLFPENPQKIRTKYALLAFAAIFTLNIPLLVSALLFGLNMPRRTDAGASALGVAKSLRNFLVSQEREIKFQGKKEMLFEKLLPYAIAFGVEDEWAKRFADLKLPPPDWYQSYNRTAFQPVFFVGSLNNSFGSLRSASSPPPSSSSGFSSGFSGGSSGGGGGGGGGGSW